MPTEYIIGVCESCKSPSIIDEVDGQCHQCRHRAVQETEDNRPNLHKKCNCPKKRGKLSGINSACPIHSCDY